MSPHKQEEVLAADKAKKEEVRGYDTVKQILVTYSPDGTG